MGQRRVGMWSEGGRVGEGGGGKLGNVEAMRLPVCACNLMGANKGRVSLVYKGNMKR